MKIFITGDKGFIASNLINRIKYYHKEKIEVVSFKSWMPFYTQKGEIDINKSTQSLSDLLYKNKIDLVIHNAAIVGTDVVALNPKKAVETNVYGTYNISMICKELEIPMIYLGTTVIYDTHLVNDNEIEIEEETPIYPRTLYATTKYEGEMIVKMNCQKSGYAITRPLFCYGGIGDMNSLIAKSIYNVMSGKKEEIKIFLDPEKIKDYMHVLDYVDSIIEMIYEETYLKNQDFNVSLNQPVKTIDIVKKIDETFGLNIEKYIKWVPETDYLGNHIIDNTKFKIWHPNWHPGIDFLSGAAKFISDMEMKELKDYNPLKYLEEIEKKNIDIEKHYK